LLRALPEPAARSSGVILAAACRIAPERQPLPAALIVRRKSDWKRAELRPQDQPIL
jgi:hypothetical protein